MLSLLPCIIYMQISRSVTDAKGFKISVGLVQRVGSEHYLLYVAGFFFHSRLHITMRCTARNNKVQRH